VRVEGLNEVSWNASKDVTISLHWLVAWIESPREVKMSNLAEILKNALSLDVHDRATLAERLLASLEELSEEEADRLWADEAQRRLEEYRAGRAKGVPAEEVHEKAEKLLR
jgi:putative addiction module component (TIGR02574 family)